MPIRLQDVLLPLAAGAASAYSPRAGRAISGGLQGMLAIKENERRDKDEERKLSLQEQQQAQQEQMFAIQLGEAQARADQRNRAESGWREIGNVFGERVPDGVYRQRDASGAEVDWVPTRDEQATSAEDPALYEAEQNRRAAAIAAKQGMAQEAIEFKRQARDISEQSQRRLSDVYRESRADSRLREEVAARMALERERNNDVVTTTQGVDADGNLVDIPIRRNGTAAPKIPTGIKPKPTGATSRGGLTQDQKNDLEAKLEEYKYQAREDNPNPDEREKALRMIPVIQRQLGISGKASAADLADFYTKVD